MLPHSIFESASRKIERANQHIADLQAVFEEFSRSSGYTIHVHGEVKGSLFFEVIFTSDPPRQMALILADAVHNLRTALDHAVWELIGHDRGTRDRYLKLPTGNNRINFESSCKGIKTPQQSTIDFFVQLALYPQGAGSMVYWLCQLDNAEKHTIISPVVQAASVTRIEFIDLADNSCWVSENVLLTPGSDGRSYIKTEPGIGINCNDHFKTTTGVFFGDVQGVQNEPIIPTLIHFRDAVVDTLRQFRRLVVERNPGIPKQFTENLLDN